MDPFWFDLIVAAILIIATIRGAMKGLVWQLAWIAAIVLGFAFSEIVSLHVAPLLDIQPPMNRWVAMFGLYLVATLVSFGIAWRVRDSIEKWKMEALDTKLGAAFGLVKGVVICMVGIFFLVTLSGPARDVALNSYSGYGAGVAMEELHDYMPPELHDVLHPYIHYLDDPEQPAQHHADDARPKPNSPAKSRPYFRNPFENRSAGGGRDRQ